MTEAMRHCKLCGFSKPLAEFYKAFRKGPDRPPTYSCYCKDHMTQRTLENQIARGIRNPNTKRFKMGEKRSEPYLRKNSIVIISPLGENITVTSFDPWNSFTVIPPLKYKVISCSKSS